jgi:hypothetical protein
MSHPIEALRTRIEALNDPDDPLAFVERLSVVACGALHHLEFWQEACTPFSDYEALFASPAFRTITRFVLRQPNLSAEQIDALRMLHPQIQFLLVRYSNECARSK